MKSVRLLGPSLTFFVVSGLVLVACTLGLLLAPGPVSIVFAVVGALVIWRMLGVSVWLEDCELVVRNVITTLRLPAAQVDVRARVVDPRREQYAAGDTVGYPEIPTAADDNTVNAAKWYLLEHRGDRYKMDALMGRTPANHERLAIELRRHLLSLRDGDNPESGS